MESEKRKEEQIVEKKDRDYQSDTILYFVIPCYNEEDVLPITSKIFYEKLMKLIHTRRVSTLSRILFVNDGSTDDTWNLIKRLVKQDKHFIGVSQSRNRGHQSSLLAGLMEAKNKCDVVISMDCDGQDDIESVDEMLWKYENGNDIVYGVRDDRKTDSFFKRTSAQAFYKILKKVDKETIYNHADFRLTSKRVLDVLSDYNEVNLYLRGVFPLIGFQSDICYYQRQERMSGKTHYSLGDMIKLGLNGLFNNGVKPLRWITYLGTAMVLFSIAIVVWIVVCMVQNVTVPGWSSILCVLSFFQGVQLVCLGVISEYVGRIYMEVKHRPRYVISERCGDAFRAN